MRLARPRAPRGALHERREGARVPRGASRRSHGHAARSAQLNARATQGSRARPQSGAPSASPPHDRCVMTLRRQYSHANTQTHISARHHPHQGTHHGLRTIPRAPNARMCMPIVCHPCLKLDGMPPSYSHRDYCSASQCTYRADCRLRQRGHTHTSRPRPCACCAGPHTGMLQHVPNTLEPRFIHFGARLLLPLPLPLVRLEFSGAVISLRSVSATCDLADLALTSADGEALSSTSALASPGSLCSALLVPPASERVFSKSPSSA